MKSSVFPAPLAHGHAGAAAEEPAKGDVGTPAAEGGDGRDGRLRVAQQREDALHAHMLDFVLHRVADRLAEAQDEEAARDGRGGDHVMRRQPVARLAADALHGLQDEGLAPPPAARRFPADHEERAYDGCAVMGPLQ